jgi:hypothetical protein
MHGREKQIPKPSEGHQKNKDEQDYFGSFHT